MPDRTVDGLGGPPADGEAAVEPSRPSPPSARLSTLLLSETESGAAGARERRPETHASDLPPAKFVERELIGRGGFSTVARAFDRDILRDVAVKVLAPEFAASERESERFAAEARITGQLEHPNVVPVYEFGLRETGSRYLCMKLVEGDTLDDVLAKAGEARLHPDALADYLQIFVKICEAVSFAHSRGVLHRDLKPRNIMISDFGQVYVVDWGIARLLPATASGPRVQLSPVGEEPSPVAEEPPGTLIGTPCYMPPEQLQGQDVLDVRSDVFSLGGTLYQILTGRPPLTAEAMRAIWTRRPPPPIPPPETLVSGGRVPPELSRIALRALAYEPADRYASVAELKHDIESFQRGSWHLPRVAVAPGTVIVKEGERGDAAYVIQEGTCVAYRVDRGVEIELRIMGPGEVFGETAVFSDKPRTASVKAAGEVVLLKVTSEALSQAVGLNSWMGAFVRALADRFREVDEKLRNLERR